MITLLIVVLYLIGFVLAYGRAYASMYCIDLKYPDLLQEEYQILYAHMSNTRFAFSVAWSSWFGFLVGVVMKYIYDDAYWFRYRIHAR